MNTVLPLKFSLIPFVALASSAFGVDYATTGGDPGVAATWTPSAAPIIAGGNITPLAGDRLLLNGGNLAGAGQIIINTGAGFIQTALATGQHNTANHIDLAGTGTDGLGAFQNLGNDWANVSDVRLTANATVRVESGGWRHDNHGTANNMFNLNGKTLSVIGNNSWWFVNTDIQGAGTMNVDIRGEFNFEAGSVLRAGQTLNLLNTRSSSWGGGGQIMAGNVNMTNSILEVRHNDNNKTYSGTIGLTGTNTFRTTWSGDAGSPVRNDILVTGQITGTGKLVKDGNAEGVLHLNNATNNYSGGTDINVGQIQLGAAGAIPSGSQINVNGGALDLNGFNQNMGSGTISATVMGAGTLNLMTAGTKTINAGAVISNAGGVNLSAGTLATLGSNALAGISGPLVISDNATLKPSNQALSEFHRVGADLFAADDGTTGATASGLKNGIPAIDSTAKPYGDNNKFVYTGKLINTTAANIGVAFGEQYDDQIRVKVDGATVLLDGGWNTATASPLVNLTPGSHDIEISSFDGVGGAGPNSGWDKGVGIRVGAYTITDPNGGGDNAAFNRITSTTLPAGLLISTGTNITDTKPFSIAANKTLTVDTSGIQGVTGGNSLTLSGAISGAGRISKTGAGTLVLSGVTTTRSASVSAGALSINGTHSFTSISVASGATLQGTGSAVTAVANIDVGGHIAPGNSVGTITLETASINGSYDAEASGAGVNDLIVGDVIWGGTSSFNLALLAGYVPALGASFDFVNGFIDGFQPTMNLPALGPGKMWDTTAFLTDGILTVVVPEPGSALLGALGLGFLFRRRR